MRRQPEQLWSGPPCERAAFRRRTAARSRGMRDLSIGTSVSLHKPREGSSLGRKLRDRAQIAGALQHISPTFVSHPLLLVIIRTMSISQEPLDSFSAGTLAGAGCFRCGTCGFAVALNERDEVPACPHCGGEDFRRSSIFGELEMLEPTGGEVESPDWLAEAREAVDHEGDYLAYDDGQLRMI